MMITGCMMNIAMIVHYYSAPPSVVLILYQLGGKSENNSRILLCVRCTTDTVLVSEGLKDEHNAYLTSQKWKSILKILSTK